MVTFPDISHSKVMKEVEGSKSRMPKRFKVNRQYWSCDYEPHILHQSQEMEETRGSIAFFATYRPPVPLDIYAWKNSPSMTEEDEFRMTDGTSSNYNGQDIPPESLKIILRQPIFAGYKEDDVDSGKLNGMVFVSERDNLEILYIALDDCQNVEVFRFADVFGTFAGVRMEDSGCVAGDYMIYTSTMEPAAERRQPWTAVYRTNLVNGITDRLTPSEQADLSPSVSLSGEKIAVASFQDKPGGWDGEIEDLNTNIFVIKIERPSDRTLVVHNGGWPTWGSDDVLFFHRKVGTFWRVFRADISDLSNPIISEVTPDGIHAMTPAALDDATVVVATIREKLGFNEEHVKAEHYRHIEIFNSSGQVIQQITRNMRPMADHYSPFVINFGEHIGYHRCRQEKLRGGDDVEKQFYKVDSPHSDVGLFRVSGVFPTFSNDGSKLAFVDNEFKAVWVADKDGLHKVFEMKGDSIFSPVWNQNSKKDILYVCKGPSFKPNEEVKICLIPKVSGAYQQHQELTEKHNDAFPSTNPEGTKIVFRSTRYHQDKRYKNLCIMEDAQKGEFSDGEITRLTWDECVDTHCQWSPNGDWIVFSSTRDKPEYAPESDNDLDFGYFAIFLIKWDEPSVYVRVMESGNDISGHVNHPFFSPDGRSIVVTSDIAAVSVDPISLPLFLHSVRPYGDIFTFDIDEEDIYKNESVQEFKRVTHSRYENSTGTWTRFSTRDANAAWNRLLKGQHGGMTCPYLVGGINASTKRICE